MKTSLQPGQKKGSQIAGEILQNASALLPPSIPGNVIVPASGGIQENSPQWLLKKFLRRFRFRYRQEL